MQLVAVKTKSSSSYLGIRGSSKLYNQVIKQVKNPWTTETAEGSFIDVLEGIIRESLLKVIEDIQDEIE